MDETEAKRQALLKMMEQVDPPMQVSDPAKDVIDGAKANLEKGDKARGDYFAQMNDAVKMGDPNVQGPRLPAHTPEMDGYYGGLANAVAGSVAPVPKVPYQKLGQIMANSPARQMEVGAAKSLMDATETASQAGIKGLGMDQMKAAQEAYLTKLAQQDRLAKQYAALRAAKAAALKGR